MVQTTNQKTHKYLLHCFFSFTSQAHLSHMSSLFPVSLNPPLTFNRHPKTNTPLLLSLSTISKFQIYATSSNSDREEIRWIREEQRWLREEQRWLREEQRWIRERESLLRQISELKLHVKALETRNFSDGVSVSDAISNIAGLLQVIFNLKLKINNVFLCFYKMMSFSENYGLHEFN